jgi:hypothetical protein
MLVDISHVTTATAVLGTESSMPLFVAPTAFQRTVHPDGEVAMARAAAGAGTVMCLSTFATATIEEVAAAAPGAPRWFQLYWSSDRGFVREVVEQAEAAGFRAVVLTVDLPRLGRREEDLRTGFVVPEELPVPAFLALAEEGFRMLFAPGQEPAALDPIEKIRAGFWRLYEFSKAHPEYYALMFLDRSVPPISNDWQRFGFVHELKARFAAHIQTVIDAGLLHRDTKADAAFRILMAAIHGVAVMRLCGRLGPREDADALARDTLEAALTGLRTGISHTFHPEPCE